MSIFSSLTPLPEDPILSLNEAFRADPRAEKINLGVGAYKDENGKPLVLSAVREAERRIFDASLHKQYLPISGDAEFTQSLTKLVLGPVDIPQIQCCAVQTLGGTGALRLGLELLKEINAGPLFLSTPTWPNHEAIADRVGLPTNHYRYYNQETGYNFVEMKEDLASMPRRSIVLLQASCHNPTGFDPTPDQWRELSALCKKRGIIPFFDMAYQGFGEGLDEDAFAPRLFVEEGHDVLIAVSCSKNFGLYGERVGMLTVVCQQDADTKAILSHLKQAARGQYSMPVLHGARIVKTILNDDQLRAQWETELAEMRERIVTMRTQLRAALDAHNAPLPTEWITEQRGMFSYSGLGPEEVAEMREKYGIFMPTSGRINVAGLTSDTVEAVARAFAHTLQTKT